MPDFSSLRGLGKLTSLSAERGILEWFPPVYSADPAVRTEQRVAALTAFVFGPMRSEDVQEQTSNPIKAIPRLPYLELLCRLFIECDDLLCPKVRRMIMSIFFRGGFTWKIAERPSKKVAFVYNDLVQGEDAIDKDIRSVMWASLPEELTSLYNVSDKSGIFQLVEKKINGVWRPWRSEIKPFPARPKDLRGFGGDIFWDEFATHPNARECVKAISPTRFSRSKRKGQRVLLGTVNPLTSSGRYFMELYERDNFRRARNVAKYGIDFVEGATA